MKELRHTDYTICPTPVGMNRTGSPRLSSPPNLPHARGDEPLDGLIDEHHVNICPTPVGMNRGKRVNVYL